MTTDEQLFLPAAPGNIRRPTRAILHRNAEYDEDNAVHLLRMQKEHFWYVGRHRFLYHTLRSEIRDRDKLHAIDVGGGCGGWLAYLQSRGADPFTELALADSSLEALSLAGPQVADFAGRYQIDLYDLRWKDRWDVVFLLDVLEHLENDVEVLRQIHAALRPGGLLFVTTPALPIFHSYNDDLVHHLRRYTRADFARLASQAEFAMRRSRYFMFFLSPLVLLRRLRPPATHEMSKEEIRALLARTHEIPPAALNHVLQVIFSLETPLGWHIPFPWGTSLLGIFHKV